ncbi:MAG: nitrate reductase molybdenum cofactor assembly chaperone [Neisseriaceae bacterium]|nr:nitrate reductase molybdenum cofactor assembly chaperone [Neisseriaceae bacterium]MBP6863315.1 nitrate reductase molybdenum cofactor assembly chaperone [Neisseriaceae bacterium]
MNLIFKLISTLLCYPTDTQQAALADLRAAVATVPVLKEHASSFDKVLDYLESRELITLQEEYVAYFDRNRSHALYLFEHLHGEDRDRGSAMVDLLEAYRGHGFDISANELPDYLPLLLEFMAQVDETVALSMLSDAIHVINHLGNKLHANHVPYAPLLTILVHLSPVCPEPLVEPPVRDMDEAMELFGASPEGVEPLIRPGLTQTVQFYPNRPMAQ